MMDIVKGPGVDLLGMVAQLEGGDTEKTAVIEAIQQIQKEVIICNIYLLLKLGWNCWSWSRSEDVFQWEK